MFGNAVRVELPAAAFPALHKLRGVVLLNLDAILPVKLLDILLLVDIGCSVGSGPVLGLGSIFLFWGWPGSLAGAVLLVLWFGPVELVLLLGVAALAVGVAVGRIVLLHLLVHVSEGTGRVARRVRLLIAVLLVLRPVV